MKCRKTEKERQIGQLACRSSGLTMETRKWRWHMPAQRRENRGVKQEEARRSLRECERICFKEGLESLQRRRAFADAGRVFKRRKDWMARFRGAEGCSAKGKAG